METIQREKLIQAYLEAYNTQNVEGMVAPLHEDVVFENFSSGTQTHTFHGKTAFRKQAEKALGYFSSRKQTIKSIQHLSEETQVEISYWAIAAIDFPNGIQKGQEITLDGKSVFRFSEEKILSITDYA